MPARRTIGVDIGGTKLLAGALDPALGVHHRTRRRLLGLDQSALLDAVVDAVGETREAVGEVDAVGFGIPSLIDRRTGMATMAVNLPLGQVQFDGDFALTPPPALAPAPETSSDNPSDNGSNSSDTVTMADNAF